MRKETAMQKARRNRTGNRVAVVQYTSDHPVYQHIKENEFGCIELGDGKSLNIGNKRVIANYRNGKSTDGEINEDRLRDCLSADDGSALYDEFLGGN